MTGLFQSSFVIAVAGFAAVLVAAPLPAAAQSAGAPAQQQATKGEDGKFTLPDGTPTYHVDQDGTWDWYTYSGYRRYHSECHVCHGPDGAGSSYAPALADSLKNLTYQQFMETVVNGKKDVNAAQNLVMPSFGENLNVMCYLDDIYVYLKARADGALGRVRPDKHESKNKIAAENENNCFGRS